MKPTPQIEQILGRLAQAYPEARTALEYRTPFELLVAVILSAQCTDARVNIVTRELFKRYNTPEAVASMTAQRLLSYIASCGLAPTKSRNILATASLLLERHGGQVPATLEELIALPGVGRKTANVVLSNAFGIPTMPVDTHVFRVANRLGLSHSKDVLGTEQDLMKAVPKEQWIEAHHWLILHGRALCKAQRPLCEGCLLASLCSFHRDVPSKAGQGKAGRRKPLRSP